MSKEQRQHISRRSFLKASLAGGILAATGLSVSKWWNNLPRLHAQTFIARVDKYQNDLASLIVDGMRLLGVTSEEIRGKRILLKPNLVETYRGANQINTHPLVVRGAAEAFLQLGAQKVLVAEGPGHRRDTFLVLEESGLADVLYEDRIPFINLNDTEVYNVPNAGGQTTLKTLTFSRLFKEIDWVVTLPKLKTHHWTGVTLSMKNLFGVMPGICYGWPKNVLHHAGINECILDITSTLKPNFAIVDGIVGMEGDGPIMGSPVQANVLVMGRNLPAVDATCARLMGINPHKIGHLALASNWLGPIHEKTIQQVGESIASQQQNFLLLERIPSHRRIRLT
jgi:uncharacterized protein (DUF362 family)